MQSLANIKFVISQEKLFKHFPIGSSVKFCPELVAIRDFWSTHKKNCTLENSYTENIINIEDHLKNISTKIGFII